MLDVSIHDLDGMTHFNCLVVAKGLYHTEPIKYCREILKTIQYYNIDASFIFQMGKYVRFVSMCIDLCSYFV